LTPTRVQSDSLAYTVIKPWVCAQGFFVAPNFD
jgi:hypothetical protein